LITYTLSGSANGYDLTNITVYGGWADNGRDQQAYTVYYSKASAPTNFIALASINYNPSIAANSASATRVTLTSAAGVMAANVAAVKFDLTSPTSENGYCGYAQIAVFGTPSAVFGLATIPPAVPAALNATPQTPDRNFIINVNSLVAGRNYMLQSTTDMASGIWNTETNFVATQSTVNLTNSVTTDAQKFYRIVGY
jgi:hypothetical protein